MKRLLLAASVLVSFAAIGTAASAQTVTGTVNVTGSVATRCVVIPGSGSTFTGSIPLGELADTTGVLKSTLSGSTAASPAGTPVSFQINCNGSDATVSLSSDRLANALANPAGYSNQINYTAEFDASLAGGTTKAFTYDTTSLPAATTGSLGDRLANAANNVTVKIYGLSSKDGPTTLLVAGAYSSTISVSITPTT